MTEYCPAVPCDLKLTTDTSHRVSRRPHHGYLTTYGRLPIMPKNLEVDQLSEPSFSKPLTRPDVLNNTYPFTEPRRSNVLLKHSFTQGGYPADTDDGNNDGLKPTLDVSHRILAQSLKIQCAANNTALTGRYNNSNTHLINSKHYQKYDIASETGSVHSDLKLTTDCRHRRSTSGARSTNLVSSPDYNCVNEQSGNLVNRQGVGIERVHNGEHNLDTESVTSDLRLSVDSRHRRRRSVESVTDEPPTHRNRQDFNHVQRPTSSVESVCSRDKYLVTEPVVSDLQLTLDCSHRNLNRSLHEQHSSVNQMGESLTNDADSGLHLTLDCSHRNNNSSRFNKNFEWPVETHEGSCRVFETDEDRNSIMANQTNIIVGRSMDGRSNADNQGRDAKESGLTLTPYINDCSDRRRTHSVLVADQSLGSHSDSGLELTLDCSHRTHSVASVSDNSFSAAPVDTDNSTSGEASHRKQRKAKDVVKDMKICPARRQMGRLATQNSSHRESSSRSLTQNSSHTDKSSKRIASDNKDCIAKFSDQAELRANEADEKKAVFSAESNSVKQGEAVFVDIVSPCFSDNKGGVSKSSDQAKPCANENNGNFGHALEKNSQKRRKRFRSGSDSNLLISNKKFAIKRQLGTQKPNSSINICHFDSSCQPGDNVLKPASKDNIISETEETITGSSETSTKLTKSIKNVTGKSEKAKKEDHALKKESEKSMPSKSEKAKNEHHALKKESEKSMHSKSEKAKKEHHALRRECEKRALKSKGKRRSWPCGDRKLEFIHSVHQAIAKVDQNTGELVPGVNTASQAGVDLSSLETIMPLNKENGENDRKAKHSFLRKNGVLYRRHESNGIWESVVSKYVS